MKITVAKTAGFCFGVDRAVNMVYKLGNENKNVSTLGPIIHNPQVVDSLSQKGVKIINNLDECSKDDLIVIRSHGVSKKVYDYFDSNNINFVDATCPFVSKIHKIVAKKSKEGYYVLIAGDKNHPEIVGISGHCMGKCFAFKNMDDLNNIIDENNDILLKNKVILVSQTTFNIELWNKCVKRIKSLYTNIEIFDTICSATNERQSEAISLAKESDLMIVIGGKNSSNTSKLKEVCSPFCKTILIESPDELDISSISSFDKIGITAGASTPAYIIKEVLKTVEKIVKSNDEEYSFAELFEQSVDEKLYTGKKVKGIVTSISPNEIQIDIGAKQSGFVPIYELTDDPNANIEEIVKKGEEIEVMVLKINDVEGTVMLSKKRCDIESNYKLILDAYNNKSIIEGVIIEVVKSGVIVLTKNIKVFVPASLSSDRKVENLESLLKNKVELKIIEVNEKRKRAVGSIRDAIKEKRLLDQEKFWKEIDVSKTYTGKVKSITSYGAFVDIGGVDGMVHISELSWRKIKHPSEIVKEGDVIQVYVKSLDFDKKKISLGYKKADENPWEIFKRDYQKGDIVTAKVVSVTKFGAFAEILPGVDGLIHISQIDNKRIDKIEDVLSINQEIKAQIIDLDIDKKRVSLSIRSLLENNNAKDLNEN